jgi:hypothetical protein
VIGAAHRKKEMETLAPEIDVELIGRHRSCHHSICDEEHVLIRFALKCDAVELPHRAAGSVTSAYPGRRGLPNCSVGVLEPDRDPVGVLGEPNELGVPLDIPTVLPESIPEQALVVVLSQYQKVGIGAQTLADFTDRNPRSVPASRPDVRAHGTLTQLERALRDAEMGVDLERASLDTQRSRLHGRARVTVDDPELYSAAGKLVRQHQTGGAGSNDQNISVHGTMLPRK